MRNDAFLAPTCALRREAGHRHFVSRSKMAGLLPPLVATGVPLGGIGTGAITRASDGRFSRWTFPPHGPKNFDLAANGFALWTRREGGAPQAMALRPASEGDRPTPLPCEGEHPEWQALFPCAWTRHGAVGGVAAQCLSLSPFLPGDLATSALPVALFRWRLTNGGGEPVDASLLFHFANMNGVFTTDGHFKDRDDGAPERCAAGLFNEPFALARGAGKLAQGAGVSMERHRIEAPMENDGQWAIAVRAAGARCRSTTCFDGDDPHDPFWTRFRENGNAPDLGPGWVTEGGFREVSPARPTGAVSARVPLAPGEAREIDFALAWDLPALRFGNGRRWWRGHTEVWGREGRSAAAIAGHALDRASEWERAITGWHADEAARLGDTPHRAGMAINELAFLVEGMSVLTAREGADDKRRFGLIECPDYALYSTLDLWIYAAEAVGRHFPELSAAVAEDFAAQVLADDTRPRRHRFDATLFPLNPAGICPHDLGGPGEDPFVVPNSYTHRDPTRWKDLNCDFVLMVFREGERQGADCQGADWRRPLFPAVHAAIDALAVHDRDGDGLIENDGTPDQTFDNIPMRGPSAYCGGLWIAALLAGARMAGEADRPDLANAWAGQAERARRAYRERLFRETDAGAWFRVDTDGPLAGACFIEQLFGPFLARRLGLDDIVPPEDARQALAAIHRHNFLDEGRGEGAVSLARMPRGATARLPHQTDTSFQTREIQPGFNLSLAAQLEEWDMGAEADELRRSLHRTLQVERNLAFQTPAAIDAGADTCRAVLNMRALAIWWMAGAKEDA